MTPVFITLSIYTFQADPIRKLSHIRFMPRQDERRSADELSPIQQKIQHAHNVNFALQSELQPSSNSTYEIKNRILFQSRVLQYSSCTVIPCNTRRGHVVSTLGSWTQCSHHLTSHPFSSVQNGCMATQMLKSIITRLHYGWFEEIPLSNNQQFQLFLPPRRIE